MNKFKKIGLSALAGSLVAVSANAGEMSVAGSASIAVEHVNGGAASTGKSWSMGNQLTFTGGGELDNGMNVSLSFVIDQGDDTAIGSGPFDSHSLTLSNDSLGTLVFSGEGGSSAQSTLDTTAAGDIWDNGLGISSPSASEAGNNSMMYTLPSLMDDLTVQASYSPGGAGGPSASAIGFTYAGIEGLSVSYGAGQTETVGSEADATTVKGSYAYGSFTFGLSQTDYDVDSGNDDEVSIVYDRTIESIGKDQYEISEIFLGYENSSEESEAKILANRLVEQLRSGASFSAVAQQFSQSSTSGQGGYIGWVAEGQLDQEIIITMAYKYIQIELI